MKLLSSSIYQAKIEGKEGLSLIKFGASWCGPCRAYAPILEEAEKDYADKIEFYEVDVDQEPELATKFEIRGVPATFILKDGEVINSVVGLQNRASIVQLLDSVI